MESKTIVGIDMGGTNLRAARVKNGDLSSFITQRINGNGSYEEVLEQLFRMIDPLINGETAAIGIGVPGIVNLEGSIVYDVVNIPSWKEVPLQQLMKQRYRVPVLLNNDANCFALGEFNFGQGRGHDSMIGLTVGSGLGSGVIINKKLHAGKNGGAGEFGMIDYLDRYYEYYASGQFFQNVHSVTGEVVFKKAVAGDKQALKMFEELGIHLGNAIKTIMYAYDVDLIVLGGSVSKAFPYFSRAMWKQVQSFAYQRAIRGLKIEVSELENSGILGAAALHYGNSKLFFEP